MSSQVTFSRFVIINQGDSRSKSFLTHEKEFSLVDQEKLKKINQDFEKLNESLERPGSFLKKRKVLDHHTLCKKLLDKSTLYYEQLQKREHTAIEDNPSSLESSLQNLKLLIEKIASREIELFIRCMQLMSSKVRFNPCIAIKLDGLDSKSFLKEEPAFSLTDTIKLDKIEQDFEKLDHYYKQSSSFLNKIQLSHYHILCKKLLEKATTYYSQLQNRENVAIEEKTSPLESHIQRLHLLIQKIESREIDLFIRSKQPL